MIHTMYLDRRISLGIESCTQYIGTVDSFPAMQLLGDIRMCPSRSQSSGNSPNYRPGALDCYLVTIYMHAIVQELPLLRSIGRNRTPGLLGGGNTRNESKMHTESENRHSAFSTSVSATLLPRKYDNMVSLVSHTAAMTKVMTVSGIVTVNQRSRASGEYDSAGPS